ncbi:MAG: MmgE/PrpD family protein, partial [Pseudomonadota bacterium]|nr:MmgE/PrpD family protein [Pseudomonadota bacterium]
FPMSLTSQLVRLIRGKPVAGPDLEQAALMALDAVANILAGASSVPGGVLVAWARDNDIITSGGLNADPGRRVLLLGGLCHILEVDDLHRGSVVHPGCVVVPVLWSGIANGDGRKALVALLHGFEATTRLGASVGAEHYKIWHNTATCGPFGSAMAAASLLGLDDAQATHALGNAGTQAAGLWQFLDTGAMSKHLHAGRGAEAGLVAASMARHGFTGAPDILEGPRGFFAAMCPDGNPARITAEADAPWQVHFTSIKPWPSCRHTHPAIDAAQELRRKLSNDGVAAEGIETIEIRCYKSAQALCDRPNPDSLYAAKFSLQHCVAAALALDEVWFDAFEADMRRDLAPIRDKCTVVIDEAIDRAYPRDWGARITVVMGDGRRIEALRSQAKGDPELPLTREEMKAKALRLMAYGNIPDAETFADAVLEMANGGPVPPLPRAFPTTSATATRH